MINKIIRGCLIGACILVTTGCEKKIVYRDHPEAPKYKEVMGCLEEGIITTFLKAEGYDNFVIVEVAGRNKYTKLRAQTFQIGDTWCLKEGMIKVHLIEKPLEDGHGFSKKP